MSYKLYPAILQLQDGTLYKGWSFFELSTFSGEIVFNTGMTGYQEILSDLSYSGQMVVFTYPEIGNTGLNKQDNESNFIAVKALIAKNISSYSSNWRSNISLKQYIINKKIPHIVGLDTRSLTKHLRLSGSMSCILCSSILSNTVNQSSFVDLNSIDIIRKITTRYNYVRSSLKNSLIICKSLSYLHDYNLTVGQKTKNYKVAIMDFGIKFNIVRNLLSMGCEINIFPATSHYSSVLKYSPDGILLSNGPGDPSIASYAVNTVKKLIKFGSVPIFGICMGHQIINIALGADTFKLNFGHRGLNHPSGFLNYSEITSQNHGFVLNNDLKLSSGFLHLSSFNYFNLNDLTIAATFSNTCPFFSVQYHPEASPGPNDSQYLFKVFIELISLLKTSEKLI
uniref:Carbamoyl phosphate synthase small chain n=1 Tax=Polysiphonia sertularioides TaxID=945028 RepID=A0A1Z1MG69_9FLOR|nr:carbamoyl phosphate synthase small subunit [Polysiphonia sertularioides]